MKTAHAVALGIQLVSIVVGMVAPGLGVTPAVLLSLVTVGILLSSIRDPQVNTDQIIEEKVAERTAELEEKVQVYEVRATTDALTNLLNRRGGEETIHAQIARAKRLRMPISFVLIDIDHFKNINDKHGHAVGDAVISGVSAVIRSNIRVSDIAARWGGEEFLVCLPDTDLAGAIHVAEKLRQSIESLDLNTPSVTASLGCSELGDEPLNLALAIADMNLYLAKSKGRNQVFPTSLQKILDRT